MCMKTCNSLNTFLLTITGATILANLFLPIVTLNKVFQFAVSSIVNRYLLLQGFLLAIYGVDTTCMQEVIILGMVQVLSFLQIFCWEWPFTCCSDSQNKQVIRLLLVSCFCSTFLAWQKKTFRCIPRFMHYYPLPISKFFSRHDCI
jgi:hypothetical protein